MKWGWDVKWTGLGCRNMSRSFFPTCEGSQCLSCGAVMCQLRFWNFKQWPPASAHGHKSSSGKKMKNYLWTQSFCVRGFLFPSEMGRFHLFFWGPNGDSHRDAVSVNGRNTCSNFSLEPSRMILLNCARWCTCPWWLLCTIGLGFGFQGEISWRYIKCSQICPRQPSLLHEPFPNFTPLTEIEDTARNNVNKNKKVYIKRWKNKGKFANATVTRCTTLGVATWTRLHHWSVSTLSFTVAVGWRDL